MIPKTIHYCWFSGDPYPETIAKCLESWSRVMPDYTIKCWDDSSFDFDSVPFVKQALSKRKWAFMADYVRLYAIYTEGGIYLDSDVEVFKRFDDFLNNRLFFGSELGNMNDLSDIAMDAAIFGGEAGHPFLKLCLESYQKMDFILPDGSLNNTTMPRVITGFAEKLHYKKKNELQHLDDGVTVYPTAYFTHICDDLSDEKLASLYALHRLNHSWIDVRAGFSFCRRYHLTWAYTFLHPLFHILSKIHS